MSKARIPLPCWAALAVAVAITGCSTGNGEAPIVEGRDDPTRTRPSKESPPPLPDMPDSARQKTIDGGVDFVEHYYDLIEYGHETGKWAPLRELTDSSCKECQDFWNEPSAFEDKEDVLAEIGAPNPRGIEGDNFKVVVNLRVGPELSRADTDMEVREKTKKLWQDDVTITYHQQGWNVAAIEPTQLLPTEGCVAGRCEDFQKEDAERAGE